MSPEGRRGEPTYVDVRCTLLQTGTRRPPSAGGAVPAAAGVRAAAGTLVVPGDARQGRLAASAPAEGGLYFYVRVDLEDRLDQEGETSIWLI